MTPSSWLAFGALCALTFAGHAGALKQERIRHAEHMAKLDAHHEQTRRHLRAMLEIEIIKLTPGTSIPDEPDAQDEWLDSSARYALESGEAWPRVD